MPTGHSLTVLIMDDDNFQSLCDKIANIYTINIVSEEEREEFEVMRRAKFIPTIEMDARTEEIFKGLGVKTKYMSAIVKGEGEKIIDQIFGGDLPGDE